MIKKEEVDICLEWLGLQDFTKTINYRRSSYGYKHMVEKWAKTYISNDSLKEAVRLVGLKTYQASTPGNVYLPLSEKTIRSIHFFRKENRLMQKFRDGTIGPL